MFSLLAVLLPCKAAWSQRREKLSLTFVTTNATYWDIDVALEKGFFHDEGFEPEIIVSASSTQSVQNLVTGAVNVASMQTDTLVAAVEKGAPIAIIAAPSRYADWMLDARPDVRSLSDLRGKTIGVSGLRVGEFWLTKKLLAQAGLKYGEYAIIQAGTSPLKFGALERGAIAAAVLFQPAAFFAETKGFHILARYDNISFPTPVYAVTTAWAGQANHGTRFTNVIARAHDWLFNPANKSEAIRILQKYTKINDARVVARVYNQYFSSSKVYSRRGEVDLAGVQRLLEGMAADNEIPRSPLPNPEKFLLPKGMGGAGGVK